MKGTKTILFLILLLSCIFPIQTFAAEENVSYAIEDGVLEAEITGIDTTDKSQMVSVSVIRSEALEMPENEDIVYANTIYTDGKDSLSLKINLDDHDIYSYHLIVNDKTGKIAYAQPLAVRTPLTITGVQLEEKIYDGTTEGKVKEVTFAEISELVIGTDYIAEAVYDSAEAGERTVIVTVTLLNTDKTNPYILEDNTFELSGQSIQEAKTEVCKVFTDVTHDAWYEDSVQYVYDKGLMSGNKGLFSPTGNITRAQVVTTLYNLEGKPDVTDFSVCNKFTDVDQSAWYAAAVSWACTEGVASGNAATAKFTPNNPVTRQQLATFFYNYAEYKGLDITTREDISDMAGADEVSSYALDTMQWAVGTGLISGSAVTGEDGTTVYNLNPRGTATRAQMASILQRFCEGNNL